MYGLLSSRLFSLMLTVPINTFVDTTRTLALEESFFDALAYYFKTTPVRGGTWEAKVFIGKRWKVTKDWSLPDIKDVMNGSKEVIRGRSYGLIDELFGTLDW